MADEAPSRQQSAEIIRRLEGLKDEVTELRARVEQLHNGEPFMAQPDRRRSNSPYGHFLRRTSDPGPQ
jgi:hypothetical protein